MYVALAKVKVFVFGYTSLPEDAVRPSPVKLPNRLSATTSGHRSVAQ